MDTILIIEDNATMRENTAELLNLAGYNVVTAANGKEGLDQAKKNQPNLILCDIMMPELDGYGVLRALENLPDLSAIPFVFLTAKSEKGYFRKAMDQGADDYLVKPFEGEDLLKVVSARLRKNELIKKKSKITAERLSDIINKENIERNINLMTEHKTVKKYAKKDGLFLEGDTPNYLYMLISGKVKTYKTNEWGKEYITEIYKAGDFFGYSCLFDHNMHQESAVAIEDSEIALIPKQDFYQFLFSNNEESLKFVKLMSEKLFDAEEKLLKMAYDSARKRVAEALLYVVKKYKEDGGDELFVNVNRENISAIAGISPESVSRNLTDFRDEGLIETSNGGLKILNYKKLEGIKN
jgi:CRP-like cAMP-binding protein/CheY-like chemotaxis protein